MRFMVMIKADKNTEAGVMPSEQLLAEMGKYNEELVKAGVMLAGEGLHPSSKGARIRFSGEKRTRAPLELGCSPSPASITPAFTSSSLNFPMSARSFWLGMIPASESLVAFTMTMKRIVVSP